MGATRAAAARVLLSVSEGSSLDRALESVDLSPQDLRFCRALCYQTLRWRRAIDHQVDQRLRRPLKPRDAIVRELLRLGVAQLGWMDVSPHAAINETVNAVTRLKRPHARGLVNAVLRSYQRDNTPTASEDPAVAQALPDWMAEQFRADWPDDWQAVFAGGNTQAPMWLRVDEGPADRYAAQLDDAQLSEVASRAVAPLPPRPVEALPGFSQGVVSVQDGAAQMAAELLAPQDGERVLDACAAPGGKTTHLGQLAKIDLSAVEMDAVRAQRLGENLQRCDVRCEVFIADATEDAWWDGRSYDAILLDAPCSGTGVIRRHPDIKWLRRASDIAELNRLQDALLDACWRKLKPGGRLLYTTCSIVAAENHQRVAAFLERHADADMLALSAPWARKLPHGFQLLPGDHDFDGFYYCGLTKRC